MSYPPTACTCTRKHTPKPTHSLRRCYPGSINLRRRRVLVVVFVVLTPEYVAQTRGVTPLNFIPAPTRTAIGNRSSRRDLVIKTNVCQIIRFPTGFFFFFFHYIFDFLIVNNRFSIDLHVANDSNNKFCRRSNLHFKNVSNTYHFYLFFFPDKLFYIIILSWLDMLSTVSKQSNIIILCQIICSPRSKEMNYSMY